MSPTVLSILLLGALACGMFAVVLNSVKPVFTASVDWMSVYNYTKPTYYQTHTSPIDDVWNVLVDFDRYHEWNTFTTYVHSHTDSPHHDTSVTLKVVIDYPWPISHFLFYFIDLVPFNIDSNMIKTTLTLDFKWLLFDEKNYKMCWGIRNTMMSSILDSILISNRCAELRDRSVEVINGETYAAVDIRHSDENVGVIAPLVEVLYRDAIEKGFRQMNEDLSRRLQIL